MNSIRFPARPRLVTDHIPLVVGLAWLGLMGILIWLHARQAVVPPLYDARTYYFKAHAVWAGLSSGVFVNPLDTAPTFRPPGTVLLSYPFGFTYDFRGFFFRSVFFPIVLVFASILIASNTDRLLKPAPRIVLAAAFFATVSLFYHFEPYRGGPPAVSHWGLVDSFLTGLAALAMAAALRSSRYFSLKWAVVSVAAGVLMIFVKPTGVVLAAIVDVVMTTTWLERIYRDRRPISSPFPWKTFLFLAGLQLVGSGGAVLLAVHSKYLGAENMAYGVSAIIVMREELKTGFSTLFSLVQSTVGYFVPTGAFCIGLVWVIRLFYRRTVREEKTQDLEVALALLVLLFGIWFWIYGSGGVTQVRYFVPFLYASLICAVGATLTAVRLSPRYVRIGLYSFMTIAILNTGLLLAVPKPALAWQRASGVNVNSGSRPASLAQAQLLIASLPANAPDVSLYSFAVDLNYGLFVSALQIHEMQQPKPRLRNTAPVDWQRPSTFRIDDIVGADYLLYDPGIQIASEGPHDINTFGEEANAFNSWVASLTNADGVSPFARARDSAVLRVTDRAKLRASVTALVARHHWRAVFVAENPPRIWSDEAIQGELQRSPASSLKDVRFGDELDMRGVTVKTLPGGELRLEVWLSPLVDSLSPDRAIAIHALDAKGRLLAENGMYIGPVEPVPRAGGFWYVHKDFRPPPGTTQIGVGVYGEKGSLAADRGLRDRANTRVILAVPPE